MDVFATKTDQVVMMPIYAAREVDDGTITSGMLVKAINEKGGHAKDLLNTNDLIAQVASLDNSWIVLLLGAGDAYLLADILL